MTNTSNPPYRWPGHGTILSMWDQVEQFCKRLEISSQVRAMLSPGAGEKNFRRHEELTILVILHYLLKNNITFMWGIEQEKSPPEGPSPVIAKTDGLSPEGGGEDQR